MGVHYQTTFALSKIFDSIAMKNVLYIFTTMNCVGLCGQHKRTNMHIYKFRKIMKYVQLESVWLYGRQETDAGSLAAARDIE